MRLALALLLAASPAAAAGDGAAGLRLLYRRASDGARLLQNGTVAPEFFGEFRRPGSRSAFELALGGSNLSSKESGPVTYVDSGGSGTPTTFAFKQSLTVMPSRLTYKYGPRGETSGWHVGAGFGLMLGLLERSLSFGHGPANADFAFSEVEALAAFELHLQAGAHWRVWERFGLGVFARWSHAASGETVYSGYRGSSAAGHRFERAESLGNAGGLDAGAEASWRF